MHRIADYYSHYRKASAETRKRAQIFALVVSPLQRQYWLRGEAQLVGNGYADAAIANI
jgi:hypothetical protein